MRTCTAAYGVFYRWLVFFGLVLFGAFAAHQDGLAGRMLTDDASRISAIIMVLLLLASLHAGARALQLGREICGAQRLKERALSGGDLFVPDESGDPLLNAPELPPGHARDHLLLLATKIHRQGRLGSQELLLERLENVLGRGHETGWFIADLMIRLGLLGTVIGFIVMLGSVAGVSSVDLQTLQQLLTGMSGGMRIALYTTLTGLGAGILLGFQYRMLDAAVDRLMAEIIELAEVHAAGHLRRLTGD
jgi:hypothetical protein